MRNFLLLLLLTITANKVYSYDLLYAYRKSVDYNSDYLQAVAQNKAGQENVVQGRASLLPQISAGGTLAENYYSFSGTSFLYHQPTYTAQISQVVFDFSKFSQYTKSKYATQLADLQLINARQQLMTTVAQYYFNVLYAIDSLTAIEMTKVSLERQLNQAKNSFEAGTVTIADINDAQAAFDAAAAQEIQAQNDLINQKNLFRNLTGLDPEQIQPLKDQIDLTLAKPDSSDAWSKISGSNNLNIKIANKQVDMASQDISIARAGHLPTVNIIGNYQYQDVAGIDSISGANATANAQTFNYPGSPLSSSGIGSVGLNISIPIYSGGAISSQVRQAIANLEASQQQKSTVARQVDQQSRYAFWQVQNGINLVKAQAQALKSSKLKLDSDQLGYQAGVRNSIDLVNSQKNYYQTYQTYNQARYQLLQARLQLKYLSGNIDDTFMQLINNNIKQ